LHFDQAVAGVFEVVGHVLPSLFAGESASSLGFEFVGLGCGLFF
jgi:hypothetical protein